MRYHDVLLWQKWGMPGNDTKAQNGCGDKVDEPLLRIAKSVIRVFQANRTHLDADTGKEGEGGEPRSSAVFNVSPFNRSVMPSDDAHCSKMDSSL